MGKACVCGTVSLGNTGIPNCVSITEVLTGMILFPEKDNAGDPITITISDYKSFATLEPLLNQADASQRLYPLLKLENVEFVRDEPLMQEYPSGRKAVTRDGFKNLKAFIPGAPPALVGQLMKWACSGGQFVGLDNADNTYFSSRGQEVWTWQTEMYGFRFSKETFFARFVEPTDTEEGGVEIMFQLKASEKDEWIRSLANDSDFDWTQEDLYGLIDVEAKATAITTAGFTVELVTADHNEPVTGLLLADFSVDEISPTPGSVALTSVTETGTGTGIYDVVFAAPETSGDQLQLTVTKNRFDFSNINENIETAGQDYIEIP